MPVQQSSQTFTPNEAAIMVGTAAHNVRRWTEYHSAHLSPLATPPPGQARRYNGRDVEVLKHVKALRSQGLTVPVINEQLSGLTFAEIDNDTGSSSSMNGDSEELAPTTAQEGLQQAQAQALVMVVESLRSEVKAIQEARRFDAVGLVGLGIVIGLVFATMFIALASLYGG